jgi:diguanylate cyclase (GGDEF)-like protein/PAS domain S-box-containing protein
MLAFESVKSLLFPTITVWQSHWLTIGFSTIVATAVAVLIMKRMDRLHQHALVALAARQDSQQRTLGTEQALRERQLSSTAQQRFGALVEHSTDVIMIMDPAGQVLFESPATQKVTGFQAAERGQFTALDEVHPDDLPHAQLLLGQVLAVAGATAVTDLRIRHRDGGWRWVDVRATNMIDVPAVAGVIVNYRDITERRQAQDAAVEQAAALRLLASVATAANTATSVQDALGGCLRAVCAYTGWSVGHAYLVTRVPGAPPMLVSSGAWADDNPARYAAFADASQRMTFRPGSGLPGQVLATGAAVWDIDLVHDGAFMRPGAARTAGLVTGHFLPAYEHTEVVAVLEFFSQTRQPVSPQLTDLMGQVSDQVGRVIAREDAATLLHHEVLHDALTGLPNRRLFADRTDHALKAAQRHHHQVAVLLLDLDWFKTINDSLGHSAGDTILREIADRLQTCLRPGDTVARLGGDEFALLLPAVTHPGDGQLLANRILDVLRLPFRLENSLIAIQASIGMALSASDTVTAEELLRDADIAMYCAKAAGRGQALAFTPTMHQSARRRLEMGGDLQRALQAGEFTVYYQPKVAVADGRVIGTEALARWHHPERGMVPPATFIPVAEETGAIVALGEWVLNQACAQTAAWQRLLPPDRPISVAVNLSVKQFGPALTRTVSTALHRSGLPAQQLTLEITESLLLDDDHALAQLLELHALGVRLSIDDFGTGYSSLSRLRSCPIDELKIDKSFIDEITDPHSTAPMVNAVITLAHAVDAIVVAEGVETPAQLQYLTGQNCDVAQGYLFSRPAPPADISPLLTTQHTASRAPSSR